MKRRHILAVLGLTFVTLGVYVIYWLYKTRKELAEYLPDKNAIPRVIILFAPLLGVIGLVIFSIVATAAVPYESPAAGALGLITGILAVVAVLGIIAVGFWWFYYFFRAVETVVQNNNAMLYYTLWIILTLMWLGPFWILIVQDDLNKFIDNGYKPLKAPAPQQHDEPSQHHPHHTHHAQS